jgi:hypothetical protein
MAQIDFPDVAMEPMTLVPVDGVKKGFGPDTAPLSKPSVGGPVTMALTADMDSIKDDPDLVAYIKQSASSFRFFVVQLACTFVAESGESFEEVWVKITLKRDDSKDESPPLAWSMKPDKQFAESEVTKTAKFGSDLKLLNGDLEAEAKRTYQLVYLEPRNELQSNPTWYLKSIDGVDIGGCYRFRMVVRAPLVTCFGTLDVVTNVRRKRWGVIPYSVVPPGAPQKPFALG